MRKRMGWGALAGSLVMGAGASFLAGGCSSSSNAATAPAGPKLTVDNYPQPQVGNAVKKGDPLWEGQFYLLYDTWGGELGGWPVDFLLSVLNSEPQFFGHQFENFGYVPDPADDLPIGYKRGTTDPTLAGTTCAPCHTGRLPDGSIWFGQPNVQLDASRLDFELNKRWMALGNPSKLSGAAEQRATVYGPGRTRIDSDDYAHAVPANVPAHYDLAQRTRLSTVGAFLDARSDIFLAVGTIVNYPMPGQQTQTPFPDDTKMNALVAFMTSHHPPTPPAQDPSVISAGKAVFHSAQCDGCHHPDNLGEDGVVTEVTEPGGLDRLVGASASYPRGAVHTDPYQFFMAYGDPSQAGSASGQLDPRAVTIIKFSYVHQLNLTTSDGYLVPSLHGLWATAPYLSNGSIPTLQDLLSPAAQRPVTFSVGDFTVDTTQTSNSNMGHEFGTALPANDKTSLIAYLNSL